MADVIYKRGLAKDLPEVVTDGEILVTTDAGEMYVVVGEEKIKITDSNKQNKFLELSQSGNTITATGSPYTVKLLINEIGGVASYLQIGSCDLTGLSSIKPLGIKGNLIPVNGTIFTGLGEPIDTDDAVPKGYVDSEITKLDAILQEILTIIKNNEFDENTVNSIEQIIVEYLETKKIEEVEP